MPDTVTRRPSLEADDDDRTRRGPWLTMPRLWLIVALGAIGVMELIQLPSAIDLAYHIKVGQLMVAEHALPRTDVLAWTTAGRPWLDQNWGAQLVMYGLWRLGGFPLLTVVNGALAVATWALVAAACRRRTANLRLIAGAVLAGYAASAAAFSVRPQMFSLLLFAVELYLLEVARTRPRAALAIPLLMPGWAAGSWSRWPASPGCWPTLGAFGYWTTPSRSRPTGPSPGSSPNGDRPTCASWPGSWLWPRWA